MKIINNVSVFPSPRPIENLLRLDMGFRLGQTRTNDTGYLLGNGKVDSIQVGRLYLCKTQLGMSN